MGILSTFKADKHSCGKSQKRSWELRTRSRMRADEDNGCRREVAFPIRAVCCSWRLLTVNKPNNGSNDFKCRFRTMGTIGGRTHPFKGKGLRAWDGGSWPQWIIERWSGTTASSKPRACTCIQALHPLMFIISLRFQVRRINVPFFLFFINFIVVHGLLVVVVLPEDFIWRKINKGGHWRNKDTPTNPLSLRSL